MDVYQASNIKEILEGNTYVGRGLIIGKTEDDRCACIAYFIMGRSENSRNRIFIEENGVLRTEIFNKSKVKNPELIIYNAVREYKNNLVVTNGDQTDTIIEGLKNGISFGDSLKTRRFEPDSPNFTPRISGILTFEKDDFSYEISILKSADCLGKGCSRALFSYPSNGGVGHFIHTYAMNGNPIPSYCGEPERVFIPDSIDDFTDDIWNSLDKNNKISLFVMYKNIKTGETQKRLINKNK